MKEGTLLPLRPTGKMGARSSGHQWELMSGVVGSI